MQVFAALCAGLRNITWERLQFGRLKCKLNCMSTKKEITLPQLEQRRKNLGLSRKRWLKIAGVEESTVYRWFQGKTKPRASTLERLKLALDGRSA